jgi:hypothetical protein
MVKFAGKPQYRLIGVYIGLSVLLYTFVLYGSTRFRLPLEPFFLLFAGALVADITGTSRRRALILVVAVVLINISLYLLEEPLRAGIVSLLQRWGLK